MEAHSLGLRTELALRAYAGSEVEDAGDHLVVRTPANPTFWWGNCLVLADPPSDEDAARRWLETFERELPDAAHRTFYVDGVDGRAADLEPFVPLGFTVEPSVVLTARSVHPPARPDGEATCRPLADDTDWAQQVELSMAGEDVGHDRDYCTRKAAADRSLVDRGHGRWYGAFLDGRLVSSMGLFAVRGATDGARPALARFQSVKTHPDHRGRGLAGTLTHVVGRYGLDELGAETLVMVADPAHLAIRVYRSVGFRDTEVLLGAERRPPA